MITCALASSVWAHRPGPNTRGWRSTRQPWARTSRAAGPDSSITVRLADTSTTDPKISPSAVCSTRVSKDSSPSPPTISHSSGPSHSALRPPAEAAVLGSVGRTKPRALCTESTTRPSAGLARKSSCALNGTSRSARRPPLELATSEKRLAKPSRMACLSAIADQALLVVEDRLGNRGREQAIGERGIHLAAHSVAAALHQGKGEGPAERPTAIARGDVADDRHRRFLAWFEGELRPFGQQVLGFHRKQSHQVHAVGSRRVRPPVRAAADEVFLLGDDPAHPQVLRRDRAVRVLPDDGVALLGPQYVHRLGAVWRNAEWFSGCHHGFPERQAVPAGHIDLEGQFAGEADAADARRNAGHHPFANGHEGKAHGIGGDGWGQSPQHFTGARPGHRHGSPLITDGGEPDAEIGPLRLQPLLHPVEHGRRPA